MSEASFVTTSGGQQVLILREGSTQNRGRRAQNNNISAAKLIADLVKTSLGPRGMDKMLVDSLGDATITNDGATMLKEMDVEHPIGKMIIEVAKTVDKEAGDGTTSSVVLTGALLEGAGELIEKGVHPMVIINGYSSAAKKAQRILEEIAVGVEPEDTATLRKIARTSMASKLISNDSAALGAMVVDALLQVAEKTADGAYRVDVDDLKVEKRAGGSLKDTSFTRGIVLDKEVVHSGMPKRVEKARIALVNSALEIKKTEFDAKINIVRPEQIQQFIDEETRMLKGMVDKIIDSGANVLICQKGIDDVAQHYLAKAGILSVRRVKESDMAKLAKATGARMVTGVDGLATADLGQAGLVEERKLEDDRWVFVVDCKNPKSVSILIRGGSQRVIDEAERSIHDAVMVVKDVLENPAIVAGGGAVEEELAYRLSKWAATVEGREQLAVEKFAEALESIPLSLASNAGFDQIDTQVELRESHGAGKTWAGVDVMGKGVRDMFAKDVIEPISVKEQVIKSATECACMILRIDDVIAGGRKGRSPQGGPGGMGGTE
ncbi:MAG: TCP-1/cpn60 chaperonin family protein [Nitrososphaerota archaeon]|nr:TCP-1/cpn60 chaperonin family protein [Nitrososphaerota archaeon]MDG6955354.1 TCP-1/cpn60 chaperonin family protein [Nitrososphaerota archaeon]